MCNFFDRRRCLRASGLRGPRLWDRVEPKNKVRPEPHWAELVSRNHKPDNYHADVYCKNLE